MRPIITHGSPIFFSLLFSSSFQSQQQHANLAPCIVDSVKICCLSAAVSLYYSYYYLFRCERALPADVYHIAMSVILGSRKKTCVCRDTALRPGARNLICFLLNIQCSMDAKDWARHVRVTPFPWGQDCQTGQSFSPTSVGSPW